MMSVQWDFSLSNFDFLINGLSESLSETVHDGYAMTQTILVVDDEARLVSLVKAYLEQANYRVVTARNGRDALFVARGREARPDRT